LTTSSVMKKSCVSRSIKHSPGVHWIGWVTTDSDHPPGEGKCLHPQNTHLARLAPLMSISLDKLRLSNRGKSDTEAGSFGLEGPSTGYADVGWCCSTVPPEGE